MRSLKPFWVLFSCHVVYITHSGVWVGVCVGMAVWYMRVCCVPVLCLNHFFFKDFSFYSCVCAGTFGGQKKALDPMEQGLQVVGSHLTWVLRTKPR